MSRRDSTPHALYRRSPTLFLHWRNGEAIARDYAIGVSRPIDPESFALLSALTGWTRPDDLARSAGDATEDAAARRARLDALVAARLIEVSSAPVVSARGAPVAWESWSPEAAIFHFGTKHGRRRGFEEATRQLYETLAIEEYPDTVKRAPRRRRPPRALPPFDRRGALPDVLLARRTWRRFGEAPLPLDQLSTLLGLTFGVQRWMRIAPEIRSALKTSPSGGACHAIEAYVVTRRVQDTARGERLAPGIHHYDPDRHALSPVRRRLPADPIVAYLGGQPWYRDANALVFMTMVLPRAQWKYRFPRAYRSVLLEAGHFCQTFCLVATWLGLAPFCTGLFDDARVERALRIDGVDETVIYAAGVGARPADTEWAPLPAGQRAPLLELPSHAAPPAVRRRPKRRVAPGDVPC